MDIDNSGMASRIEPLSAGDTLRPIFPGYYADTLEFAGYYTTGAIEDYVLSADGAFGLIWQAPLPNGTYWLTYQINDIYGNSFYTTAFAKCVVDTANQIYPYSMLE